MAMLAESRQKARYNLMPKGKPLYEDETRFGTKMLEKMGWKKGQGLGLNEDGMKDFIRIRYKNDAQGLGFEQRDDQWTQHEQSFNGLLTTLNGGIQGEEINTGEEKQESDNEMPVRVGFGFQEGNVQSKLKVEKFKKQISGLSLEERSKQSKARVHYKKFTKCKDLAQYSEKDLANIFGKKAVDDQIGATDLYQALNKNFMVGEEKAISAGVTETKLNGIESHKNEDMESDEVHLEKFTKKRKNDLCREENEDISEKNNPTIIFSNVSVNDYFKLKMEAMKKSKTNINIETNIPDTIKSCDEVMHDNVIEKKRKKKRNKHLEKETMSEPVEKKSKKFIENANLQNYLTNENGITEDLKNENVLKNPDEMEGFIDNKTKKKKLKSINKKHSDTPTENTDYPEEKYSATSSVYLVDDLAQETIKKKKNKTKELNVLDHNVKNKSDSPEKKKTENVNKEVTNISATADKSKKECASPNDTIGLLNLEDIQQKMQAFNIYPISSFCAEKFRNTCLNQFKGSKLPEIAGYGLGPDLQLDVQVNAKDEERITNLWSGVLNKYIQLDNSNKIYQHYVRKVIKAKKAKLKNPKLSVKAWKRKNVFQVI